MLSPQLTTHGDFPRDLLAGDRLDARQLSDPSLRAAVAGKQPRLSTSSEQALAASPAPSDSCPLAGEPQLDAAAFLGSMKETKTYMSATTPAAHRQASPGAQPLVGRCGRNVESPMDRAEAALAATAGPREAEFPNQ